MRGLFDFFKKILYNIYRKRKKGLIVMVIRQKKFGTGKLVEIRSYEWHNEQYYSIELREVAGDWMPWEIREDGTRHIMSEFTRDIDEAQKIYDKYTRKIMEERN